MASFEQELATYVVGLGDLPTEIVTGGTVRFWPMVADSNATQSTPDRPYVVYERISENDEQHMTGANALATATYQFSIFALTYADADTVSNYFRTKLNGQYDLDMGTRNVRRATLINETDNYMDLGDGSQRPLYRIDQDWRFHYVRSLT